MATIRRHQRCPQCGSLNIIKWSVRGGRQRFRCKECGHCFTPRRSDVSLTNRSVWFRKWVLGKQTISDIAVESGYSERQLRRWFEEYLIRAPVWVVPRRKAVHMLIDGTWLSENRCLIVYRDADSKSTLYYRFAEKEDEYGIIKDLTMFKTLRMRIASFTTDGAEDIVKAIRYTHPQVTRQRCIVHIRRECLSWLTQRPKTAAGITLRRIVSRICDIKTNNDRLFWIKQLRDWHGEYEDFILQKSVNRKTGELSYTHDNVRRSYIHLQRALPNMFKYIDEPAVPNNTNGLESFFGHLKDNLRIHRGLSREHQENFIKWYLFFVDEKKRKKK